MPKCEHSQPQPHAQAHPQQRQQNYLQRRSPSPPPQLQQQQQQQQQKQQHSGSMRVLLSLLIWCLVAGGWGRVCAERDFNFNDSQVPLLEPRDEPAAAQQRPLLEQDPYEAELARCHYADSELLLSLVLKKHDWSDFSEPKRAKVLEQISKFFAIPKEFVAMETVTKRDLNEMQAAALRKGANNKCQLSAGRRLGRVNFVLGCGATYFTMGAPIAAQIDGQMRDGYLDHLTGMKFGWWAIWRRDFNARSQRNRRAAEGSGDVDDYYDDDYEYDTDDETNAETVTEIPAVTTHAHRHHHGLGGNNDLSATNDVTSNNSNNYGPGSAVVGADGFDDADADADDDDGVYDEDDADESASAAPAAAATDDADSTSNAPIYNKNAGPIDEEIVESVSQLESVISKTIENTKNIKEVLLPPVIEEEDVESAVGPGDEDDDDVDVAGGATVELGETPSQLEAELSNALAEEDQQRKAVGGGAAEAPERLSTSTSADLLRLRANELDELVTHSPPVSDVTHHHAAPEPPHISMGDTAVLEGRPADATTSTATTSAVGGTAFGVNTGATTAASASSSSASVAGAAATTTATATLSPLLITATASPAHSPTSLLHAASAASLDPSATATTSSPSSSSSSASSSPTSASSTSTVAASTASSASFMSSTTTRTTATTAQSTTPSTASLTPSSPSTPIQPPTGTVLLNKQLDATVYDEDIRYDDEEEEAAVTAANVASSSTIAAPPSAINHMLTTATTTINHAPTLTNGNEAFDGNVDEVEDNNNNNKNSHNASIDADAKPTATTATTRTPAAVATAASAAVGSGTHVDRVDNANNESNYHGVVDNAFVAVSAANGTAGDEVIIAAAAAADNAKETDGEATAQPEDTQNVINRAGVSNVTPQTLDPHQHAATATTPGIAVSDPNSVDGGLDDVEEQARALNTPPVIDKRLDQFQLVGGKIFSYTPPADTFYDSEDKTNLRWELTDEHGAELKPTSWLQFDAETREFYGIPLDSAVHKYEYRLTATDSGNESISDLLLFGVQQHHSVRAFNHEVSVTVKINEKQLPAVDWQMRLARAIATTLGDASTNAIVVTGIQQAAHDPGTATFVYFNETLPISECPEAQLNDIVKRLDAHRLSQLVQPALGIKSITGQLIGHCAGAQQARPKPAAHPTKNSPPEPRNQVDLVNATVGQLLVFKVPADTFYDDDPLTLTLSLRTKDHKELSAKNWLQFDSKNQEFYGVPKSQDVGSEEYVLVAEDGGGLKATDALVVDVKAAPKRDFSVYFKAFLAIRFEQFNAEQQRKFMERIAHLFGDSSAKYIQQRSLVADHDNDGTIMSFYNTSLFKQSHSHCPEEEIEAARSVFLVGNQLRDRVKKEMGPELGLTNVQVTSQCHQQTDGPHREFTPTKTEEPTLKSTFAHEYMYTFILPAIIIVVMILIASIVACCLHRRRHKSGKMELGDEEERKAFRTKGIPVIFQDELDEKPEIGKKSPTILKIEKPPLLPPSNHTTTAMNGDNDVDEYVPPPAVVVGGREARGKSPATPSYRKPPPYVSP